jgi:hypothetical protein
MPLRKKIKSHLNNGLKTFQLFQRIIATICIGIPFFLWLAEGSEEFRTSISDYVYMPQSYFFGMLLTIAAMLFIFNGAVYFKHEDRYDINQHGKWYNIVLGFSLLGVIVFSHKEHGLPHYICAGTFFLGSALIIGIFHKEEDRVISIIMSALTIIGISLHWIIRLPLIWAEWFSLSVIAVHFILESTRDRIYPEHHPQHKPKLKEKHKQEKK